MWGVFPTEADQDLPFPQEQVLWKLKGLVCHPEGATPSCPLSYKAAVRPSQ